MEVIKRKILLENSIDRTNSKTWGALTADTFYINVFLTQTMDDGGIFTDIEYIDADISNSTLIDYTILTDKLTSSGLTFPFMYTQTPYLTSSANMFEDITLRFPSNNEIDYYNSLNLVITGLTDSKIEDVKSYDENERYKIGFDMQTEDYINYNNINVSSVSRVISTTEPMLYVFDTSNDINMGLDTQIHGLQYKDYSGNTMVIGIDGVNNGIPLTTLRYIGEGQNETNTSLSALTKEEYFFGIISPPEIKNDVFIERGVISVLEPHLRLSEIKNLGELSRYGNGYYNLIKQ